MFQRSVVARSLRDHFNISGNEATVHDLNGRKLLCCLKYNIVLIFKE